MKVSVASDGCAWKAFVDSRPEATVFHHFGWAQTLAEGAGHRPYFLSIEDAGEVLGVLPLCLMEGRLFGRFLVSLPHYLGGVCAATEEAADALVERACALAQELKVNSLELRGNGPLPVAEKRGIQVSRHKASFLLDLGAGEEALWQGLRKQVRNRIRKGREAGLSVETGGHLAGEFWEVFSANMRQIGSPTFSPRFFSAVLEAFPGGAGGPEAEILLARRAGRPVAGKLVLHFRDTLTLLWGATLPQAKMEGANYYLTWEALRYALAKGCRTLDMGRSTVDSGPYRFKAHWGGRELRHHWYVYPAGRDAEMRAESPRFRLARKVWRKLPLPLTRLLGPWVARQIP